MNTLVISDTHLSLPFEEKKFNFLERIISKADKVIINGDFWDAYLTTFDQFRESPWKHLFPLLKKREAVYIFGNHDRQNFSNNLVSLFSSLQTQRYTLNLKGKKYIFEHGNRLIPMGDTHIKTAPQKPIQMVKYMDHLEKFLIATMGPYYQKLLTQYNRVVKKKLAHELKQDEYYVCGHTHCAEVDPISRFINTGMIKHGLGQYAIIKNDVFYYKQEKYL